MTFSLCDNHDIIAVRLQTGLAMEALRLHGSWSLRDFRLTGQGVVLSWFWRIGMKRTGLLLLFWGLAGIALASDWPGMREEADRGLPPRMQYYNRLKGEPMPGPFGQHAQPFRQNLSEPESLNVRLVGKWGRGPAASVTGRDTLVYLGLGSEVAVFNCINAHNPIIVTEIQCRYVVDRVILRDSLLYAVLQGGVEVFNVANPASVTRIKYLPITAVDMCIADTMAYTIDADSFKAYRIVAPDSFQRLGACADSGYYIAADSGFAYLCDRWGLYVIDATDPTNPHQATILTGAQPWAVLADSGYCYYTTAGVSPNSFRIADVSDPYHPAEVGSLDGVASYDIFRLSYFIYLAGYYIVDISNPSFPTTVGSLSTGGLGVWTRSPFAFSFLAADYEGLRVVDITDPVHPVLDTAVAAADEACDICIDGCLAYVADYWSGMKTLDVENPANPIQVGSYDTIGHAPRAQAVAVRDSFANLMTYWWSPADFRVVDVSQPANPQLVATAEVWGPGNAIVVRDSLAFVAEDYKLEIFSVANPRNPRRVGGCQLPNSSFGLCLRDSLAFVANLTSLRIVNVANPAAPTVIGFLAIRAYGVAVRDTIAFVGGTSDLFAVNATDPAAPYLVSTFPLVTEAAVDIAIDGNLAFVGTAANSSKLRVFDISDPESLRCVGYYITPNDVRRVFRDGNLVYAACNSGGVCIFETTSTASVVEVHTAAPRPQAFELMPNPASSFVDIRLEVNRQNSIARMVRFYDAAGRVVLDVPIVLDRGKQSRSHRVDISALPDGCYFVSVEPSGKGRVQKVVKTGTN
jgi:hypothetical protein